MRLMRIGPVGAERPVVFDGDDALDAASLVTDFDRTWSTNGVPLGLSDHRYLRSGDVMELWIDGLGRQRQDLGAA
jgi:2-keto-4-pentenoate hydratase/2-oxohepta-3-ene-1,7-dioic acid hydratase in catechol pathway